MHFEDLIISRRSITVQEQNLRWHELGDMSLGETILEHGAINERVDLLESVIKAILVL